MPLIPRLSSLWRNLFHKARTEQELTEELDAYLEMLVENKIKEGLDPEPRDMRWQEILSQQEGHVDRQHQNENGYAFRSHLAHRVIRYVTVGFFHWRWGPTPSAYLR